jgi:predicted Zn-ribbon and HTH transcriptional regulator
MMPIHGERFTMKPYACPKCGRWQWDEIPPECPDHRVRMEPRDPQEWIESQGGNR